MHFLHTTTRACINIYSRISPLSLALSGSGTCKVTGAQLKRGAGICNACKLLCIHMCLVCIPEFPQCNQLYRAYVLVLLSIVANSHAAVSFIFIKYVVLRNQNLAAMLA